MSDIKLKPCPFCGGTDFLVETYPLGEKYRTGIVCRTCLGGMDTMKSYPTSDEARSKAEEAWNRRAESSRPHGKWIKHIDDLFPAESTLECNVCHHEQPITIDDEFCPHCGADMRKDGEADE